MLIKTPTAAVKGGNVELRAIVEFNGGEHECFYSVPESYASFADTKSSNCFLVGFLYPAMRYGEDIHVEGTVSARLLYNLEHYLIPMLAMVDSRLHRIHVTASETDSIGCREASAVGTGFSGGIDSFTTIYEHFAQPTPAGHRITHLFFFNVGAHGIAKSEEDLKTIEKQFHARYEKLKPFTQEVGLDFITVNSNIHLFHLWGHLEVSTFATVSAIMFLQKGIHRYYLASAGHPYIQLWKFLGNPGHFASIAVVDMLILPWLSTESLDLIDDGTMYDRSQKTALIADYEPVTRYLNVCYGHDTLDTNCSVCGKCLKTLLTLEILGKLDAYKNIFDIPKYRREARRRFIAETIVGEKRDMFSKHLMNLARARGVDLRKEVNCLDIFRAKLMDGKIHSFIRNNRLLKKLAKKFFK